MRRREEGEGLRADESVLRGSWLTIDNQVIRDSVSLRIAQLVANNLIEVGTADGGWSILYRDPSDGRYWEHSYPESEVHGGGPPMLVHLPLDVARKKYEVQ
jgi:hypothetical protein